MNPDPTTVQAVFFDLDGTLIDTLDLILASMRHTTKTVLGSSLPDEALMRNVGVPLIVQMREFDSAKAQEMLLVYREHNALVHDELVKEYPGVEAVLSALLEGGKRLGVVTSKSRHVAERGLDRFGLAGMFEILVSYDDVPIHKPDPYPIVWAAEKLGVPVEATAYVGDSPHDIAAANAAGSLSVAALWGVASGERLLAQNPHFMARSMHEVGMIFAGDGERFRTAGDV